MYAGHTYLKPYLDYGKDRNADYAFKYKKVFNNLANICLFEDEIDGYTSKNGILYDKDGKIACVPPRNLYAQTMPLEHFDGKYYDDGECVDYDFGDCLRCIWWRLFKRREDFYKIYRRRYPYILQSEGWGPKN